MIKFEHVSKHYGDFHALSDLSLEIKAGEIFGLIGHNGAGKTTTISLLTSIIEPSGGQIIINDKLLAEHGDELKKQIAYVPDSPDIFLTLRACDYWNFLATLYEVDKDIAEQRLADLTRLFDMTERQYEQMESFSHGMRQKAILIGALLVNPDIWVLDEPLTGLDPQASFDLKEMMKAHARDGKTVIFSTHVLSVAEQLCDRFAILKKGKLLFVGTMEQLRNDQPDKDLETIYLELAGRQKEDDDEMV